MASEVPDQRAGPLAVILARMHELLGLPYSPWSERARWVLDARKIPYRSRRYQPLLGELGLRSKTGRWRGVVSVPVLTTSEGLVIADSVAIARWADERGEGPALFPKDASAEVDRLVALSDRGLASGRALSLLRLLEQPAGLVEMVPKALRSMPGSSFVAAVGVRRTLRKYDAGTDRAKETQKLASVLDEIRSALRDQPTLLGRFTYADVTVSQVLAFVKPPAFGLRIARATRDSFTDEELSSRYADLLAWRDALYEAHRPR